MRWRKLPQAAVPLPPPGLNLTGWRDPFVYLGARSDPPGSRGSLEATAVAAGDGAAAGELNQTAEQQASGYRMLLGSGVKGAGGALLGYSSSSGDSAGAGSTSSEEPPSSLAAGWRYAGPVCSVVDLQDAAAAAGEAAGLHASGTTKASPSGDEGFAGAAGAAALSPAAAAHELGEVWECPLLAQLPPPPSSGSRHSGGSGGSGSGITPQQAPWLLAVSPYPCKPPNVKSNPVLYWIGSMNAEATRQAAALRAVWWLVLRARLQKQVARACTPCSPCHVVVPNLAGVCTAWQDALQQLSIRLVNSHILNCFPIAPSPQV